MKWAVVGEEGIDSACDFRVFDQRRGVMRFAAGVDDE
jgi:hypothetical protein